MFAVLGGWGIGIYTAMKVCSKVFLIAACPYEAAHRVEGHGLFRKLREHILAGAALLLNKRVVYLLIAAVAVIQVFGGKEKEATKEAIVEA